MTVHISASGDKPVVETFQHPGPLPTTRNRAGDDAQSPYRATKLHAMGFRVTAC